MSRVKSPKLLAALFTGLAIAAFIAVAGPLDPPPGPVTPTGATLGQIAQSLDRVEEAVVAPLLAPTVGYQARGLAPGTMTSSLQTLVSGQPGVIKRIIVDTELWTTPIAVEIWVDGQFAGSYRGPGASGAGVAAYAPPLYEVNIKFNSSVQAKLRTINTSSDRHSVSIHYLPN